MADNLYDLSVRAEAGDELRRLLNRVDAGAARLDATAADMRVLKQKLIDQTDVFSAADRTEANQKANTALVEFLKIALTLDDLVTGSLAITIDGTSVDAL